MQKFVIPGRLDNLNDYTYACRASKFGGNSIKKKNEKIVINNVVAQDIEPINDEDYPLYFKFKWYEQNKKRDLDNTCFAKKFIFDALQSIDIIKNDNWGYICGFTDEFYIDKENPRIEIEIYTKNEK